MRKVEDLVTEIKVNMNIAPFLFPFVWSMRQEVAILHHYKFGANKSKI